MQSSAFRVSNDRNFESDYLLTCFFLGRFRQVMQSILAAISIPFRVVSTHIIHLLDVKGEEVL
jgi:hypothetical protein